MKTLLILLALSLPILLNGQTTAIPDPIFEQELIDQGIDTDGTINQQVLTADISGITSLDVSGLGINDLTGIEGFISIEELRCNDNNLSTLAFTQNPALTSLYCQSNQLTSLDVTSNLALDRLWCNWNQLPSLDVSNNTALTWLRSHSNPLGNLDVLSNPDLTELHCYNNQLTNLNLTNNTALVYLHCQNNSLTELNVSSCPALANFSCGGNMITSLDLSNKSNLQELLCQFNNISDLDLSNNTKLRYIYCNNNNLVNLNVKSGSNSTVVELIANNNPLLSCIEVDNEADANAGLGFYSSWVKDPTASYSEGCTDFTYIPDPIFEQALIDQSIDSDATINQKVLSSDISGISSLSVYNLGINDLTGIEGFTSLGNLSCSKNNLTSLNTSSNTNLWGIYCSSNQISSLDLSNNMGLQILGASSNQLSEIDVTNNKNLSYFSCSDNLISSLDLSQNSKLTTLNCAENNLESLDVKANSSLSQLWCGNNQITSLFLKHNTLLTDITCEGNNLRYLNIKNGANAAISYLNVYINPALTCIEVDNEVDANAGIGVYASWNKDVTATYSEGCSIYTYIPDTNFEQALIDQAIDSDGTINQLVLTSDISGISSLMIVNKGIFDLTGIEDFTSLSFLDCGINSLSVLNLSQNTALEHLYCWANTLNSLDVSTNTILKTLECMDNQIQSLDLINNPLLEIVVCEHNQLLSLDLSQNINLTRLNCSYNPIEQLNVKNGNNPSLTLFRADYNTQLLCIEVDDEVAANAGTGSYSTWIKDAIAGYSEDCPSTYITRPVNSGWSWFSINVEAQDMSLGTVLNNLTFTEGDYIKSKTQSATYYDSFGWFGDLSALNVMETYKLKLIISGTILFGGDYADPSINPIPIGTGWNWIGYIPPGPLPIDEALASISPMNNDYIKSQAWSATFYDGVGWFGDLNQMDPLEGYMLKSGKDATLTYPDGPVDPQMAVGSRQSAVGSQQVKRLMVHGIEFNPSNFELSGQVNAEVFLNGQVTGNVDDILVSYSEGRLVGQSSPMIFPPTGLPVFNHLAFENSINDRELEFYYYDADNDQWYEFEETLSFNADMIEADAFEPFRLEKASMIQHPTSDIRHLTSLKAFPNPASNVININLVLADDRYVTLQILDPLGRVVDEIQAGKLEAGSHQFTHDIRSLKQGYYLIRMKDQIEVSKRLIITH